MRKHGEYGGRKYRDSNGFCAGDKDSLINNEQKKQSIIGIVAAIFGIVGIVLSIFGIGVVFGIVGIILGAVGLSKRRQYKIGMSVTEIATGGAAVLIVIIIAVASLAYLNGEERGWDDGWDSGYDRGYDGGYNEGYEVPWYDKW